MLTLDFDEYDKKDADDAVSSDSDSDAVFEDFADAGILLAALELSGTTALAAKSADETDVERCQRSMRP